MNPVVLSSERMDWGTPQALFDALDARFGFELDVCATAENAKCERFFSPEDDGLQQPWTGVCWMNPPYGRELPRWMAKARASALKGATVVCLVPSRTDTRWWQGAVTQPLGELVASAWQPQHQRLVLLGTQGIVEVQFLPGRVRFEGAGQGAPFPSAVVAFIGITEGRR